MSTFKTKIGMYAFVPAIVAGVWCYSSFNSTKFYFVVFFAAIIAAASAYAAFSSGSRYGLIIGVTALVLILASMALQA